jgi:hypothetical protein
MLTSTIAINVWECGTRQRQRVRQPSMSGSVTTSQSKIVMVVRKVGKGKIDVRPRVALDTAQSHSRQLDLVDTAHLQRGCGGSDRRSREQRVSKVVM